MRNRILASMSALVLTGVSAAGQATPAESKAPAAAVKGAWIPPRTPDGQPDLQGVWTNNTVTPLERPKELAGKGFYTEAELQALAKRERERLVNIEDEGQPPSNHSGVEGAPADAVHYDLSLFGLDQGQS